MDQGKLSASANLLRLSTLGINFALSIFVGTGLGVLLKKYLHWGDWVVLAGFLFGVVASYILLFEDLRSLDSQPKKPKLP